MKKITLRSVAVPDKFSEFVTTVGENETLIKELRLRFNFYTKSPTQSLFMNGIFKKYCYDGVELRRSGTIKFESERTMAVKGSPIDLKALHEECVKFAKKNNFQYMSIKVLTVKFLIGADEYLFKYQAKTTGAVTLESINGKSIGVLSEQKREKLLESFYFAMPCTCRKDYIAVINCSLGKG